MLPVLRQLNHRKLQMILLGFAERLISSSPHEHGDAIVHPPQEAFSKMTSILHIGHGQTACVQFEG